MVSDPITKEQFVFLTLHIKADDYDGYGLLKIAAPISAVQWNGVPKKNVTTNDVYEITITMGDYRNTKDTKDIDLDFRHCTSRPTTSTDDPDVLQDARGSHHQEGRKGECRLSTI